RRADSRAARPPELASWSECPKRSRFSSRTLVKARVDMVEENAQCGGDRDGYEHAEDPAPAETRDEGDDDENRRQANRVAHHFRLYDIQDDVGDQQIKKRDQKGITRVLSERHKKRGNS